MIERDGVRVLIDPISLQYLAVPKSISRTAPTVRASSSGIPMRRAPAVAEAHFQPPTTERPVTIQLTEKAARRVRQSIDKRGRRNRAAPRACARRVARDSPTRSNSPTRKQPEDCEFESRGVTLARGTKIPAVPVGNGAGLRARRVERGIQVPQSQQQGAMRLRRELHGMAPVAAPRTAAARLFLRRVRLSKRAMLAARGILPRATLPFQSRAALALPGAADASQFAGTVHPTAERRRRAASSLTLAPRQ